METMEAIKDRIREGIIQEEMKDLGSDGRTEAADGNQTIFSQSVSRRLGRMVTL